MFKNPRHFLCGGALAVALAAIGVCAPAQTIHAVMHAPLRSLDPVISSNYIVRNYAYLVYDTLLARDAVGAIRPQMADWKVSADGKTYTFTLRTGLKFHDGTAVTAEDALASIKRWSQTDRLGLEIAALLSDARVVDDRTFALSFSTATDLVLRGLSKPSGRAAFVYPKAVAQTPIGEAITSSVGSGPFRFVAAEFRPGVQAVFEKNTDYVPRSEPASALAGGKVVKVDRVKWTTMPDPMTAVNALLSGEVDFIEQTPPDLVPLLKGNAAFQLSVYKPQSSQNVARLNFLQPPFNDKKIRQAALLAIGQQGILDAQLGVNSPYGETCAAIFGCGSPYASHHGAEKLIKAQPTQARALLKEAGYDRTPVVILHPTDLALVTAMGPVLAQQLRDAGFVVKLESMDWAASTARRANKGPAASGGWNLVSTYNVLPDLLDPSSSGFLVADRDKAGYGWPHVPLVEEVRTKFKLASNGKDAKILAEELQKLSIDEVLTIPLGQFDAITAKSKRLSGQLEAAAPVFWNISKSK